MAFLIYPVVVMLFLGGVYAWGLFVPVLQQTYSFSASQTQWVFGAVIASFTLSMLLANKLVVKYGYKTTLALSGMLFAAGYLLASFSNGNFLGVFTGIGVLSGVGTGLGYLVSLSSGVRQLPQHKGLVTGIVSAGFGGGSILLTFWAGSMLNNGYDVLSVFRTIGIVYGGTIFLLAVVMPKVSQPVEQSFLKSSGSFSLISLLFLGILLGTFAGLMVVGNLKLMGLPTFSSAQLSFAIVLFSLANFLGRLGWGWLSDRFENSVLVPLALAIQGIATFLLGHLPVPIFMFYLFVILVGLGFAANFVLFAKEVLRVFGPEKLGVYYPVVFLGYGLAGILGPVTGGEFYDMYGDFQISSAVSLIMSAFGGLLFVVSYWVANRRVVLMPKQCNRKMA
jgi:MFS transporter, OFA family, oxalate/formate antiporter